MNTFIDSLRRVRTRLLVAAVAAACAALLGTAAQAAATPSPTPSATPEVKVLTFGKKPTSLAGLRAEARKVQEQMRLLGDEMAVIVHQYDKARARLALVNGELSQLRLQLDGSRASLAREQDLLGRRLAAMYKMGDYTWLDFLADSGGYSDPQTQLEFFDLVAEQDQRTQQELGRLASDVASFENALGQRRQEALDVRADIDAERILMSQRIAERRALLRDLVQKIQKIVAAQLPPAGSLPPAKGPYTPVTWAQALLAGLGAPRTTENLVALTAWEMAEGGHWYNTAHYNPLNTTMPEPGATSMNSVGVKAYMSWQQGFVATIATLRNGRYGAILAALARGDGAQAVVDAVAASPWGTHSISLTLSPLR